MIQVVNAIQCISCKSWCKIVSTHADARVSCMLVCKPWAEHCKRALVRDKLWHRINNHACISIVRFLTYLTVVHGFLEIQHMHNLILFIIWNMTDCSKSVTLRIKNMHKYIHTPTCKQAFYQIRQLFKIRDRNFSKSLDNMVCMLLYARIGRSACKHVHAHILKEKIHHVYACISPCARVSYALVE